MNTKQVLKLYCLLEYQKEQKEFFQQIYQPLALVPEFVYIRDSVSLCLLLSQPAE